MRSPIARRRRPPSDIAALVKDYKGDPSVAAGESFEPTPANLEARTQRFALPNGMKVALLPKKTRGETVQLQIRLHQGDETSLKGMSPRGELAASMLALGTKKRDRQAFEDTLDRLRAKLAIGGGETETSVRGQTVRTHLPELLRLAAEALREPAFPPTEFEKLKRERLTALEEQRTDPQNVAERALQRWDNPYRKGDVRYVPTYDEELAEIKAAKLDDVKRFYARFVGGANAELAIVGDFDPAAMKTPRHRALRRLEEPVAVRARARSLPAAGPHGADSADARQGERDGVRARAAARSTIAATTCRR
mgnify:CR=1 FL=1